MRRFSLVICLVASVVGSACGGGGALLRDPNPVILPSGMAPYAVRDAILRALPVRHWQPESEEQNRIVAVLPIREHVARVLITYDAFNVWIQYVDSHNLDFRVDAAGNRYIHPNYNRWAANLARDITAALPVGGGVPVIIVPAQ